MPLDQKQCQIKKNLAIVFHVIDMVEAVLAIFLLEMLVI